MTSEAPTSVTITVLTFNRSNVLRLLLTELSALRYPGLEIIVIDNHSEDDTQQVVEGEFPKIRYVRTERNLGVGARNIGLRMAGGEVIITLDDDISDLTDEDIARIVELFKSDPKLGAVNFKVIDPATNMICNWVHHCKIEDYHDKVFPTYEITEGAVAIRKDILDVCGYYTEEFFISHEGPDIAYRFLENGYKVIYSPIVSLLHHTAPGGRKAWRNYYYDTRNQLWLAARNFPPLYAAKFLLFGLSSMFIYSTRDGFLYYWFKAVFDGCKGLADVDRKVLSRSTMRQIKEIDSIRPGLIYMIKKRVFQKGVRI